MYLKVDCLSSIFSILGKMKEHKTSISKIGSHIQSCRTWSEEEEKEGKEG